MAEPEAPPPTGLPLFYRRPEPLSATAHADLRLLPGNCAFAAQTNSVPLMTSEFAAAAATYPVVFNQSDASPIAILGLEQTNLFVDPAGGWEPHAYVPAYVRRYPFVFIEGPNAVLSLSVDRASECLAEGGEAGQALYADGEPTAFTRTALDFCRSFMLAHSDTRAFGAALEAQGLLVSQQAEIQLPGGRPLSLAGWRRIDRDKFLALDDVTAVAWRRNGWAGLVHLHLASLDRFQSLLARRIAQSPPEATAKPSRRKLAESLA